MTSAYENLRLSVPLVGQVSVDNAPAPALMMNAGDVSKNPQNDMIFFNDISFKKVNTFEEAEYYFKTDRNRFGHVTGQAHLDIHFWPQGGLSSSLDSAKRSMGEASSWLREVAEDYPLVCGVTYRELAKVATRSFGFEALLEQDEIEVSKFCRDSIRIVHALYEGFNGRSPHPLELACVVASTEHLATAWNSYSKK